MCVHPWPQLPTATRRAFAVLAGVLGAAFAVYVVVEAAGLGDGGLEAAFGTYVYLAIMVGATALTLARGVLVADERRAWLVLGCGLAAWTLGDLLWTIHYDAVGDVPEPSPPDIAYFGQYVFAYLGLGMLLRGRLRPLRPSLWLDGLVVGLTLAAVLAALVFDAIADAAGSTTAAAATSIAYVVCDLVMLCFAGVAVGLTGWRPGRAWSALAASLTLTVVADAWFGYLDATGAVSNEGLINTLWPGAALLLAAAAWQPWPRAHARPSSRAMLVVPGLFALVALGVLVVAPTGGASTAALVLAAAAIVAAFVRCWLTFGENVRLLRTAEHEASTDALTALGNRRLLVERLETAVAGALEGDASTLVYCDLDGFKSYNDTFGHVAGDAMLARLGGELRAAVGDSGQAFRAGGDEFAVLLRGPREDAVARIVDALTVRGDGFSIGASHGVVALPDDARTSVAALQLADERMYSHKGRRTSARTLTRDLLVRVLDEREPDHVEHLAGVAQLAVAVGRRLGLQPEQLDEVARGAELHDIGKVAIPDAVLHKPGPLDALEWQLMRQHTLVGERILSVVPPMAPIGAIVRSSHERWDGGGYPDGLAGEAIPIGSRIVAVCDSFDAILATRCYRAARTREEALAELRRCAGSQFDPAVVAAFVAVAGSDLPAPATAGGHLQRRA